MPQIPNISQNQRLSGGRAATFDTSIARIEGESLAKLGQGISTAGQGLGAYLNAQAKTKSALDVADSRVDSDLFAEEAIDAALTSKDLAADGSNIEDLGLGAFDTRVKGLQHDIEDKDTFSKVQAIYSGARAKVKIELMKKGRVMFAAETGKRTQDLADKHTAMVFLKPDAYNASVQEFSDLLKETPNIRDIDVEAGVRAYKRQAAVSAVRGYLEQKQYKKAEQVLTKDFAGLFTGEKLEEMKTVVDKQRLSDMKKVIEEDAVQDNFEKVEKLRMIESNEAVILNNYLDAENLTEKDSLLALAAEEESRGGVGPGFTQNLKRPTTDAVRRLTSNTESRIMERIIRGDNSSDIKQEISRQINIGLEPDTARILLNMLNNESTRTKNNPLLKQQMASHRKAINNIYGPAIGGIILPNQEIRRNMAMQFFHEKVYRDGVSPKKAFNETLKEFTGGLAEVPIVKDVPKRFDQFTIDGIKEAMRYFLNKSRAGNIPAEEADRIIRELRERIIAENIKDETDKALNTTKRNGE